MEDNTNIESIKGDRSMTQGFVAQYASEAALQINGVLSLVPSFAVALRKKQVWYMKAKGYGLFSVMPKKEPYRSPYILLLNTE